MGDLSTFFDRREFACKHCGRALVTQLLVERLEVLRSIVGRPLVIVSGYRCPAHNRAVRGAKASRHLHGDAADLRLGVASVDQAERAGFVGIGSRGPWAVHVDTRPGPAARWRY